MSSEKFYTIGAAGKTIDGREIKSSWFDSIVKDYNPELKTAGINDRHWSGGLSLGTVLEVRKGKNSLGMNILQAKLKVNENFESFVKHGWANWFSMEIDPEFVYTSKAYLVGLAVTNNPASLGNPIIELSQDNDRKQHLFSDFLESKEITQEDFEGKEALHGGLDLGLFESFKNWFAFHKQEKKEKEEEMSKEQYAQIMSEIQELKKEIKPQTVDLSEEKDEVVQEMFSLVKDVKETSMSQKNFDAFEIKLKENFVAKSDFEASQEALKELKEEFSSFKKNLEENPVIPKKMFQELNHDSKTPLKF